MTSLRLGTRGSALARTQSLQVAEKIQKLNPKINIEVIIIQSEGDLVDSSLSEVGGQGIFTTAISEALVNNKIDFAVHSLKDLPTQTNDALTLAAIPKREDPRDLLVSQHSFDDLPENARIGTGSLRRKMQLLSLKSPAEILDIRGNVDTRIQKVLSGKYEAIVLATAGLNRLSQDSQITHLLKELKTTPFDVKQMTPAVGQGALALECRGSDHKTKEILAPLNDPDTEKAITIERSLLARLGGGCQVPFAAHVTPTDCYLVIADPETGQQHRASGTPSQADSLFDSLIKDAGSIIEKYFDTP